MKKILSLFLSLAMLLSLCACGQTNSDPAADTAEPSVEATTTETEQAAEEVELAIFAAASMTAALEQIKPLYEAAHPGVTLTLTLDSSGTLKTQIQEGADCDVFISAAQKNMDQLDAAADPAVNTEGLDFVVQGTRVDIVSNFCVLAVPEGNPAGIQSFEDVASDACSLIALGNADVPAGEYAQQIFTYLGLWEEIQSKITFCSNVKEVTTQVAEQAVDCGVVYGTDAMDAGLEWVDMAEEGMHDAVVYPAAVMSSSAHPEQAQAFVEYLCSEEAQEIFLSLGFSIPQAGTRIFTDSTGRQVEIPAQVDAIAVSGPLAQIVLFALAPDMLVGVANAWDESAAEYFDEKYYNLPLLGQLYGGQGELNLEQLLAADPDVIIDVGEPKDTIVEDLDALQAQTGLPFVHVTATTETMGQAYRMLGDLLGLEEEAEVLASYCEEIYAMAQDIADAMGENKTSVLYCLGDQGLNVIAQNSYHSEILDLLCNNLAVVDEPSSKGTGNETDMEQILLWDPEVILFAPDSIYDTVGQNEQWQMLSAISSGQYYEVPFGPYNWMGFPPSVQRYLGILWLADLLYPEQCSYDLYTEVARYFSLFYHCELSEEQFEQLTANSR